MTKVINGERPEAKSIIPKCYQNLIKLCWSQDPLKRPSFKSIVLELKTNQEFISNDDINIKEFQDYVKFIDECKQFDQFEYLFLSINKTIQKTDLSIIRKDRLNKERLNQILNS